MKNSLSFFCEHRFAEGSFFLICANTGKIYNMEELDFILANLHKELEKQRIKALRNIESEKIDDSQNIFLRAFNNFGIDGVKEINVMYAHALAERTLYELGLKSTHDLAEILISTCAKTQNQKDSITSTNEIQIAR